MTLSPYLRLMRLHQPVGIWLLLWPCWWSVTLASNGAPSFVLLLLFAIGAVLMRSAGCIINDIADRKLDRQVARTQTRPLASGELSLTQAIVLLIMLLALALPISIYMGPHVLLWAALSLIPVAIYPWMKRISWWPQFFLGLTFNWGALMGWVAVRSTVELPAVLLYIGAIFWTLGYDTIYAHQDKLDDARVGIKSTALRLGAKTKPALTLFYSFAAISWGLCFLITGHYWAAIGFIGFFLTHAIWQIITVQLNDPISCRRIFFSNAGLGLMLWISCLLSLKSL
ncbi:MAG: 4-hydroxybenzoate octaprenyltransferase [Rickettsiales bacterium]|nr:4-hydroxybenzoate octaprenyltransferase [Rickettsiales bacterium]